MTPLWFQAKTRTLRALLSNPDAMRIYLCNRYPRLKATSEIIRSLYPAWWKYKARRWLPNNSSPKGNRLPQGRYLLRVPSPAGIGDQIVTAWSETYLLAQQLGLTFVHIPFQSNPHSQSIDWDTFLGFGVGEIQAEALIQNPKVQIVYLPPLHLNDSSECAIFTDLIQKMYPADGILFHMGSGLYWGSRIDQAREMPTVYRAKYENARRINPIDNSWDRSNLHIAVHVRRGDVVKLRERNYPGWQRRWVETSYYVRLLTHLKAILGHAVHLHVYSDGTMEQLAELAVFPKTEFHLNQDPRRSFHEMVIADILIVSSSSFSITAGKISRGLKLVSRSFETEDFRLYIPFTDDWLEVSSDGGLREDVRVVLRNAISMATLR